MVYKEYNYGAYKKEIKAMLRKRLSAKERYRYHSKQVEVYTEKVKVLETEIEELLRLAKGVI